MELSQLLTADHQEAGAVLEVRDPVTGEPTDVRITLRGTDSPSFRKVAKVFNKRKSEKGADEKFEELTCEMLAGVTLNIEGLTQGGEPIPFTTALAVDFYTRSPGVRAQVEEFITDRRSFMKG